MPTSMDESGLPARLVSISLNSLTYGIVFKITEDGSGHEGAAVLLPGFAIIW